MGIFYPERRADGWDAWSWYAPRLPFGKRLILPVSAWKQKFLADVIGRAKPLIEAGHQLWDGQLSHRDTGEAFLQPLEVASNPCDLPLRHVVLRHLVLLCRNA